MAEERPLFVARSEDLAQLQAHWDSAQKGSARFVRVVAPFGGGRRAVVAELFRTMRQSDADAILWRVPISDQETGVQWLMRMYGSLISQIAGDVLLRGKVEMILNAQIPSETRRVQAWFQQFVASIKEAKPDQASGQIQLKISQDNPLVGLIEVVRAITAKLPIVLELQQPYLAHTMLVAQFIEALLDETKTANKLLVVISDEPDGPVRNATHPAPLLDMFTRRADSFHTVDIAPWGATEVQAYLDSKGVTGNAARIAEISAGRPGFIADLVEILEERGELDSPLEGVTLGSLTPMEVDTSELDVPTTPPAEGERKHAGQEDAGRVAYFAALLGQAFPSALVAEMGGYDKESIDDLVDAMDDLFDEVQFNEQMNTWIYRFKRGSWREGVLELNDNEEGHELARRVGIFMERYLAPRGIAFITRTCRIYGEHGAPNRANGMRALALTHDDANAWGLSYELMRYFDEVPWTDTTRRTVYTTLLDHLSGSGQLKVAERVHNEVTAYATEKEDRDLQAWLLLNGSKLDLRRQDLYRARDRARDALKMFEALDNKARIAETNNHLAAIELNDGKPDAALEAVEAALVAATVEQEDGKKVLAPQIAAQAEMIRGAVARRTGKIPEAMDHFKRANEIAGSSGLSAMAIDAGLSLGEAMLASRQAEQARDVLRRVLVATRQINALPRERATAELLAQAEGALRNFDQSLQLAQRCLQITQQTNTTHNLGVDLYHVGFFHLTQNQGKEAVPFFDKAAEQLTQQAGHPLLKDLHYYAGLAHLQAGGAATAKGHLDKALPLLKASGEARKLASVFDQLGAIAQAGGDKGAAKQYLTQALEVCTQAGLKDERRQINKRLEALG